MMGVTRQLITKVLSMYVTCVRMVTDTDCAEILRRLSAPVSPCCSEGPYY